MPYSQLSPQALPLRYMSYSVAGYLTVTLRAAAAETPSIAKIIIIILLNSILKIKDKEMKELDFDMFMSQDAGRAFYRALIIYGGLHCLKTYSVSVGLRRCLRHIETELWKSSNCFV